MRLLSRFIMSHIFSKRQGRNHLCSQPVPWTNSYLFYYPSHYTCTVTDRAWTTKRGQLTEQRGSGRSLHVPDSKIYLSHKTRLLPPAGTVLLSDKVHQVTPLMLLLGTGIKTTWDGHSSQPPNPKLLMRSTSETQALGTWCYNIQNTLKSHSCECLS